MNRGRNGRRGQALVMATFSIFFMIGMLSLAVDLGWAYFTRDAAQTAADAAAAAVVRAAALSSPSSQSCGSNGVWCGSPAGTAASCPTTAPTSPSTSFDYGCMLAASNGFTPNGSTKNVTIQANTTSPGPNGSTVSYWATVTVSQSASSFFGSPIGNGPLTSSAVSSSAITSEGTTNNLPCIYVLGVDAANATYPAASGTTFTIGNGAHVTTSSCGIYINSTSNSSSSPAMSVSGGATVTSSLVQIAGTCPTPGSVCSYSTSNGGTISSTPRTGAAAVADPFASLPSLTPAGTCNSGNFSNWQPSAYTPAPGTYCGFNVGNGMSAVLSSGNYIINGGTFSVQGGSTLTATAGVMIYLTNGATVNIANGATVNMSAQSSGSYAGILFFSDRGQTSPGSSTFAGGSSMHLNGSLYLPYSVVYINNGSNSQTEALVVNTVIFQGGATFNAATSQSQTGLAVTSGPVTSIVQ